MEEGNSDSSVKLLVEVSEKLTRLTESNLDFIKSTLAEHRQDVRGLALADYMKLYADNYARQYDTAARYSTVVIYGAYAAFFAIWLNVDKYVINSDLVLLSGILMGFSVIIFCAFEVIKMVHMAKSNHSYSAAVDEMQSKYASCEYAEVFSAIKKAQYEGNLRDLSLVKYWKPTLYSALSFGALGIMALLRAVAIDIRWVNLLK